MSFIEILDYIFIGLLLLNIVLNVSHIPQLLTRYNHVLLNQHNDNKSHQTDEYDRLKFKKSDILTEVITLIVGFLYFDNSAIKALTFVLFMVYIAKYYYMTKIIKLEKEIYNINT